MSYFSFSLVMLINLMFIIFYQVDGEKIDVRYNWSEFFIEIIGIFQAFISFLVVISYFQQQHGVIYQKWKDHIELKKKDRFTQTKGSMGYALGAETVKGGAFNAEDLQQKVMMAVKGKKSTQKRDWDNLVYTFQMFFMAIAEDNQHRTNLIYFIISLAGIFYHPLFSLLLLDVITKIPLLTSVV